jgi:type I restriction-modification system DNA methylase subunit
MPNDSKKEFLKILEDINPSVNAHEVFSDWLVLASAALYSWKKDERVEKEYMEVAKNYSREELDKLSQLLAITVDALEDTERDFLGEIFLDGEFSNDKKAQFFTPFHISKLMALVSLGELPENQICKICDPCCGSGGMFVATISVMKERNFNYQRNAFFMGTDIDPRCARMTHIQLTLLGAPAVIVCGNTLTKETLWERETFGYFMSGMKYRLLSSSEQAEPNEEKEPEEMSATSNDCVQGELF